MVCDVLLSELSVPPVGLRQSPLHGQWSEKGLLPAEMLVLQPLAASTGAASPVDRDSPQPQQPPTEAQKELLKLRKKLREIVRIEEQEAAGARVDPLQRQKLEKKDGVVAQVAQAERVVAEEEAAKQQETFRLQEEAAVAAEQCRHELAAQVQRAQWQAEARARCDAQVSQQAEAQKSGSSRRRGRRQRGAAAAALAQAAPQQGALGGCQAALAVPQAPAPHDPPFSAAACAELTECLEAGGGDRAGAIAAIRGSVARLAFEAAGCRLVQLVLQVADREAATMLVAEVHGLVRQAIQSPHANYVLQKCVEVMPTPLVAFVAKELAGTGVVVARHRYGCRILCRLLEHCSHDVGTIALVAEVLAEAESLCRHSFAHHVLQSILEHGLPEQKHRIFRGVSSELLRNARDRHASYVVEHALTHCSAADQQALAAELLGGGPEATASLAQTQSGGYVIRALLRMPGESAEKALSHLELASAQLRETRYGQELLSELRLPLAPTLAAAAA